MNELNIFENIRETNAESFLAEHNRSKIFWIGCIDCPFSPENFNTYNFSNSLFYKNAGNLSLASDMNFSAALQFAVEIKKVENIFICGHYDCEIVASVLSDNQKGFDFLNNWLASVREISDRYKILLTDLTLDEQINFISILNAIDQTFNVGNSCITRNAWRRGQNIKLRSIAFNTEKNSFIDLNFFADNLEMLNARYEIFKKTIEETKRLIKYQKEYGRI